MLAPPAEAPGEERSGKRRSEDDKHTRTIVDENGVLSLGSDPLGGCVDRQPGRVLNRLQRLLAALIEA